MTYKTFMEDIDYGSTGFTVDEAINRIGLGKFHVKLTLIAGLLLFTEDMAVMMLSILGPELVCDWNITSEQEAFLTTAFFIGMVIGSPFMGCMGDRYGMKTTLIFCSVWTIYGFLLLSCCANYYFLLLILCLTGIGLSGTVVSLTYYAEFLPNSHRGRLMLVMTAFADFGTFVEVLFSLLINYIGWRGWLILTVTPLLLFLLLCSTLPESPRYLLSVGKNNEALDALAMVANENNSHLPMGKLLHVPPATVKKHFSHSSDIHGLKTDCLGMFWWITDLKTWLLIVIFFCIEYSFYGIVLLSTQLISDHPLHPRKNRLRNLCNLDCKRLGVRGYLFILWTTTAEMPAILGVFLVDRIGRKLSLGLSCCVATIGFLCVMMITGPHWLLVTAIYITWAASAEAYQLMLIYASEVYPMDRRAQGVGLVSAAGRIGVLLTPFSAVVLLQEFSKFAGVGTYAIAFFLASMASFLLPVETSGKSLDEME